MSVAVRKAEPEGTRSPAKPSRSRKFLQVEAPLSEKQKHLIRATFVQVEPALDLVAALYFLKLFDLDPSFRSVFTGPAKDRTRKFTAAMKLVIISLDRQDELKPTLKLIGVQSRQYGVRAGQYATMAEAMIWTLDQSLEGAFTKEARGAWNGLLARITRILAGR
ncbi:MAG: globin domain-containing protein [Methyloceanibacter sp.]|uniref:globin domain-containing protein n=1 Tax=Methyloceanibacter sp. TaxID=1965321 RepID=UPI003D9ACA34